MSDPNPEHPIPCIEGLDRVATNDGAVLVGDGDGERIESDTWVRLSERE